MSIAKQTSYTDKGYCSWTLYSTYSTLSKTCTSRTAGLLLSSADIFLLSSGPSTIPGLRNTRSSRLMFCRRSSLSGMKTGNTFLKNTSALMTGGNSSQSCGARMQRLRRRIFAVPAAALRLSSCTGTTAAAGSISARYAVNTSLRARQDSERNTGSAVLSAAILWFR